MPIETFQKSKASPISIKRKISKKNFYKVYKETEETNWHTLPKSKLELQLCHRPIQCPLSVCHSPVFISDVSRHFIEHSKGAAITTATIVQNQRLRIQLKSKWLTKNKIESHLCLLLKGYVTDLGQHDDHGQCLPIMLLHTREMLNVSNNKIKNDILMFWFAGLVAKTSHPVYISLAIYFNGVPKRGLSCEVLSLHDIQTPQKAINSGHCLWMTMHEVKYLTENGLKSIEMELRVM